MGCNTGGQPAPSTTATSTPSANATIGTAPLPTVMVPPSPTATPPSREVTLLAAGDMMLDRSIGYRLVTFGPDAIFDDEMAALLRSADVTIGNLECAISERGEPLPKGYTFRAPPVAAEALQLAGFDLVSLANNHAMDYGPIALADTSAELRKQGIFSVGAGENLAAASAAQVLERNGLRIAFVGLLDAPAEGEGFSRRTWEATSSRPGVAWADPETVTAAVDAAHASADLVVVMLHFGEEYAPNPNANQRELAYAAIDAGATLVIGTHPHVLQEVEEYGGGLIAYSLGNFVFDGFEGDANTTALLEVTLTADGVADWELIPAEVVAGLPVVVE